jgi:hypothetical protein
MNVSIEGMFLIVLVFWFSKSVKTDLIFSDKSQVELSSAYTGDVPKYSSM